MANWFVVVEEGEQGPFVDAELRQLALSGKLAPTDLVRREDMPVPIEVRRVKGLSDAVGTVASTPVPPPPVVACAIPPAFVDQRQVRELDAITARVIKLEKQVSQRRNLVIPGILLFIIAALIISRAPGVGEVAGTTSPGNTFSEISGPAPSGLTIDQFRAEIIGGDYSPKSSFYEKYGKPLRTTSVGDDIYMFYECSDGIARVMCPIGPFEYQDWIAPVAVDPH